MELHTSLESFSAQIERKLLKASCAATWEIRLSVVSMVQRRSRDSGLFGDT